MLHLTIGKMHQDLALKDADLLRGVPPLTLLRNEYFIRYTYTECGAESFEVLSAVRYVGGGLVLNFLSNSSTARARARLHTP